MVVQFKEPEKLRSLHLNKFFKSFAVAFRTQADRFKFIIFAQWGLHKRINAKLALLVELEVLLMHLLIVELPDWLGHLRYLRILLLNQSFDQTHLVLLHFSFFFLFLFTVNLFMSIVYI